MSAMTGVCGNCRFSTTLVPPRQSPCHAPCMQFFAALSIHLDHTAGAQHSGCCMSLQSHVARVAWLPDMLTKLSGSQCYPGLPDAVLNEKFVLHTY